MFKKLKEKLDETGIKTKLLDYAANASSGSGEASGNRTTPQTSTSNKKESSDATSTTSGSSAVPDQSPDVTTEDWSVKEEPPPVGWAPAPAQMTNFTISESNKPSVQPSDTEESEVDDVNTSLEGVSKEKLLTELTKWHARYQRAKTKYTQKTKAYQELNYEKEKIQGALAETQDRLLRRQAELREQCVLEQQAKAHLEQNLRVTIEEKDQLISVLETKIGLLKDDKGQSQQAPTDAEENKSIEELQKKVKRLEELLNRCRATLNSNKEQSVQMKKQLEEKDKEVKHALEQELKLKEQLLHWEQESRKECEGCRLLNTTQQDMQQSLKALQEQLTSKEEKCNTHQQYQADVLALGEEKRLLQQQLELADKELAEFRKGKEEMNKKEETQVSALQQYEDRCHSLQQQVEHLQIENSERNNEVTKLLEKAQAEKKQVEDELNVKSQQIEGLMRDMKNDSDETVRLKVECTNLQTLVREKEEKEEELQKTWHERENEFQKEISVWKERQEVSENQLREATSRNETLEFGKVALENALQETQADRDEKIKSLEVKIKQLENMADETCNRDTNTISTLKEQCESLEQDLILKSSKLEEVSQLLEKEREGFSNKEKSFKEKEDALKQTLSSLEIKCSSLETTVQLSGSDYSKATELYEQKYVTLSEQLNSKDRDLAQLNFLLDEKMKELEVVSKERDESLEASRTMDVKCQNLIGQLSSIQNDSSQTIQELQTRCTELQANLELNGNNYSQEINASKESYKALERELLEKERMHDSEVQRLKEELLSLEASLRENDNARMQDAESFHNQKDELLIAKRDIEERLHEREIECQKLIDNVQSLQDQCCSLENELQEVKQQREEEVSRLKAECETLQASLASKEEDLKNECQSLEESCKTLKMQLVSQAEEHTEDLQKLNLEVEQLQEKLMSETNKQLELEEKCQTYEKEIQQMENDHTIRVSELEGNLQTVQNDYEAKLAEHELCRQHLQEGCAKFESIFTDNARVLHNKVGLMEDRIYNLVIAFKERLEKSKSSEEKWKEKYEILVSQLNGRESEVVEIMKNAEDKCRAIETGFQETIREKDDYIQVIERKCKELEEQAVHKNDALRENVEILETRCSELKESLMEKEVENAGYLKKLEEKQGHLDERTVLIQTLEEKCESIKEEVDSEIQEYKRKIEELNNLNQQMGSLLTDKESTIAETKHLLDEKINQNDVLVDAERRYFEKTQSLEEACQKLVRQLEEREAKSNAVHSSLKDKCVHLEDLLKEQNNDNQQNVAKLEEKCQKLEIQLKDIEEDHNRTVESLEERCRVLQAALESKEVLLSEKEIVKEQSHHLENSLSTQNNHYLGDSDSILTNNKEDSSDETESLSVKCQRLEERESTLTSTLESLKEKLGNVEDLLVKEQCHGVRVLKRLAKLHNTSSDSEDVNSNETVPLDWQSQADTILDHIEQTLSRTQTQVPILPEVVSLFEERLSLNPNDEKVKKVMLDISKQMQEREQQHHKELQLAYEKAESVEQRFMQQEAVEVQQLAQEVSEQRAVNENIREHFLLQIQEKDEEIQSLQKQLQNQGVNKKSDWDSAWDMEEDEQMCNNTPVQNLVNNELQAVMNNDNKADLDQLERFLAYPSTNSTTPKLSLEPTEYEYLRNILLAYMTGREPLVMAKVITAVLRFPEKDTQEILRRESLKTSVS